MAVIRGGYPEFPIRGGDLIAGKRDWELFLKLAPEGEVHEALSFLDRKFPLGMPPIGDPAVKTERHVEVGRGAGSSEVGTAPVATAEVRSQTVADIERGAPPAPAMKDHAMLTTAPKMPRYPIPPPLPRGPGDTPSAVADFIIGAGLAALVREHDLDPIRFRGWLADLGSVSPERAALAQALFDELVATSRKRRSVPNLDIVNAVRALLVNFGDLRWRRC